MSLYDLPRADAPASQEGRRPKHLYVFSENQDRQDITDSVHQIRPQSLGLIVFDQTFQTPMTHGSDNHLPIVVRYSRTICKYLLSSPRSGLNRPSCLIGRAA